MRSFSIILFFCSFTLVACNNAGSGNGGTSDSTKAQPATPRQPAASRLTAEGTQSLLGMMTKYYALKNALVATKAQRADSAATELAAAAANMTETLQKDSANAIALKPYMDTIAAQTRMIITTKDETCERQRLAFGTLSSAMYGLLKHADLKNGGVYHTYCPMAFNDKGAYWLSEEAEVKNPYFGKKMLECGEVTDSL